MPPHGQGLPPGTRSSRARAPPYWREFFGRPRLEEEEEEEEFFNHYKNDLERHAHTPSGVAGADLKSQGERFNQRS